MEPMSDEKQRPVITKDLLRELGDWRAEKLGRELAAAGAVLEWHFEPPFLHGTVRSAGVPVKTRLKLGPRGFDCENLCSCRQARVEGTICGHAMALVFATMQTRPVAPRTQPATSTPALPALKHVPLEDATDSNPILELMILLPLDLPKAWRSGEIRVILEGRLNGQGNFVPFDTISKEPTYAVSDADERVLAAGKPIGVWMLKAAEFDVFFSALAGHPRVWLGKRSQIEVTADKPRITVALQPNGEAVVTCHSERSEESLNGWAFDGRVLSRSLPASYPPGEHRLTRAEFARFHQLELPALNAELTGPFAKVEFTEKPAPVRVTLDGALAGLNLTFESSGQTDWTPDPENPFRYWRSRAVSDAAVLAAGFEKREKDYRLASEQRVGHFLANTLPAWERKWQVTYGPQFAQFLRKCDRIQPELTVAGGGNNWLALDLAYKNEAGALTLSPPEVQRLLQTGAAHQRLANGRFALLPTSAVQQLQDVIFDCDATQSGATLKLDRKFAPYLAEALRDGPVQSKWEVPSILQPVTPLITPDFLRSYQRDGVQWLHSLTENRLAGILADEMGLGKTVQTLVWLRALGSHRRKEVDGRAGLQRDGTASLPRQLHDVAGGPSLIVCPTSLLANWQAEIERFTPEMKALVLHGSDRQPRFAEIPAHDVVITSYALLRRDLAEHQKIDWQAVVLDEAQHIKNRFSQNAQAVKSLRATRRLVLTGTPMENSLGDLWSIFDFLMPGYLGPAAEFRDRYEVPITKQKDEATLGRLRQRLRPFVLRRTKSEVATELPAKIEQVTWCELTGEQQSVYQTILAQGRREVFESAKESQQRLAVLTTLLRLRQACCHLGLLPTEREWLEPSAKLATCLELIEEASSGGHRVLVFSQFVKLLKLVQAALPVPHCYLDGSTVDRAAEIRRFQESAVPVFLISLKAGGTGLNLTGADTVIHLDPWWNPAVEEQATARAHRIGQRQVVTSYKLIARGTVEEKIVRLQESKRELTGRLVTSDETFVQGLNFEDLKELLS